MRLLPIISILSVLVLFTSCQKETSQPSETIPDQEERGSSPSYPNLVGNKEVFDEIKQDIDDSETASSAFSNLITAKANSALNETLPVASGLVYNTEALISNSNAVYAMAIQWVFEENNKEQFLEKIVSILSFYAKNYFPEGHTPRETHLLPMFEGYSIVRNSLTETEQKIIDDWLIDQAYYYKDDINLTGNLAINNWNTIRLNYICYFAMITDHNLLKDYFLEELKTFIPKNIYPEGDGHDFEDRDALAYHAYNLKFYANILKAVLLYLDMDLYNHPDYSRIKKAVDFWEPYLIDPENNVHLEFINTQYEPDKQRSDYGKPYNPGSSLYVLEDLVSIDSRCFNYIKTINPEITIYNRSFDLWINRLTFLNQNNDQ
jgi:hypothetical protein